MTEVLSEKTYDRCPLCSITILWQNSPRTMKEKGDSHRDYLGPVFRISKTELGAIKVISSIDILWEPAPLYPGQESNKIKAKNNRKAENCGGSPNTQLKRYLCLGCHTKIMGILPRVSVDHTLAEPDLRVYIVHEANCILMWKSRRMEMCVYHK